MNQITMRSVFQANGFLTAALLAVCVVQAPADELDFLGGNTGPIPDAGGGAAGLRVVNFDVSGVTGPLTDIRVTLDLTHPWMGDVWARLLPPGTNAGFTLFTRVGYPTETFGYQADLGGSYTFHNGAPGTFWAAGAAAGSGTVPSGDYRTADYGSAAPTDLLAAFASLAPAALNGTWELNVWDTQTGDTGTITGAKLKLGFVPVPEPGTATLLALGLTWLLGRNRRRLA